MRRLYTVLFYIAMPFVIARMLVRSLRNTGYRYRLLERFGFNRIERKGCVHFHLVSVGETLGAVQLIEAYMAANPNTPIVVTSTTPTGSAEVLKRLQGRVDHCYLPFDLPGAMARFYRRLQPSAVVLMETELWPNMLNQLQKQSVNVVVVNARLSARSARGYRRFKKATTTMMSALTCVSCVDRASRQRFIALGVTPSRVVTSGNMKYDLSVPIEKIERANELRVALGDKRPVWIAGSTHEGEESIILAAHKMLLQAYPNMMLMIAPRHPERFEKIYQLAKKMGFTVFKRSDGEIDTAAQVMLCDTLGELQMLYGVADICFVGGSLIEHGGHNPIEPVMMNKPVISGESRFNFQQIYGRLEKVFGVVYVSTEQEVAQQVAYFLRSPTDAQRMATNAAEEIQRHKGALAYNVQVITDAV